MLSDFQCGLSPVFSLIIHTKNAYLTKYQPINKYQCGAVRHVLSAILFRSFRWQDRCIRKGQIIPSRHILCVVFFKPRVFRDLFRTLMWRAQTAVHAVFRYFVFDPLDISWFWSRCYNMLYANMLHAGMKLSAPAKTPFRCYLLALF